MSDTSDPTDYSNVSKMSAMPKHLSDWSHDDPSHSGFVVQGIDDTAGRKAYFIQLEAKEGKEDLVASFLRDINNGVNKEPNTGPWFGLRYSKTTFCIFEAFPHAQARHDHDAGPGGQNFFVRSDELQDMLAYPAQIYRLDVLHGKFGTSECHSFPDSSDLRLKTRRP